MTKNINNALTCTFEESTRVVRTLTKTPSLLSELIHCQINLLPKVRKNHPGFTRGEAIQVSLLNAAMILFNKKDSEQIVLANMQKVKQTPQLNWLKLRRNYILNLNSKGASLREIKDSIYYRFHHKISHTQISKFLKMEVQNA